MGFRRSEQSFDSFAEAGRFLVKQTARGGRGGGGRKRKPQPSREGTPEEGRGSPTPGPPTQGNQATPSPGQSSAMEGGRTGDPFEEAEREEVPHFILLRQRQAERQQTYSNMATDNTRKLGQPQFWGQCWDSHVSPSSCYQLSLCAHFCIYGQGHHHGNALGEPVDGNIAGHAVSSACKGTPKHTHAVTSQAVV